MKVIQFYEKNEILSIFNFEDYFVNFEDYFVKFEDYFVKFEDINCSKINPPDNSGSINFLGRQHPPNKNLHMLLFSNSASCCFNEGRVRKNQRAIAQCIIVLFDVN